MTTYKWQVINYFMGLGEYRTHSNYKTETKRDAETLGREYVSNQKGYANARKSEIFQVKYNRLRSVIYQDSFIGLITWRSDRMEKLGHDLPAETFTSKTFDRLIDHYHKVFDLDSRPSFRRLRADLPRLPFAHDPDTMESIRADLPEDLVNLYIAGLHIDNLVLLDAHDAIFDLLEEEYKAKTWYMVLAVEHGKDGRRLAINKPDNLQVATKIAKNYDRGTHGYQKIVIEEQPSRNIVWDSTNPSPSKES